jgi:hypothetical protein
MSAGIMRRAVSAQPAGTATFVTPQSRSRVGHEAECARERVGLAPGARARQYAACHEVLATVVTDHDALVGPGPCALEFDALRR